jgi:hypothetical protein
MFLDDVDADVIARWNVPAKGADDFGVGFGWAEHRLLPLMARGAACTVRFGRAPTL